ncbi:endonuclease/exonuclease/phosphatase family protein [Lapidilactobacillus gannanensis]|jgi:hypothetical protein|uniref:Endonuclease/exonuclease/phosphatase family protein n=1 Tax=Lapidilactobacillus gannanensis TaxID=2486002 RepID=A0ABW4BRM0_9LACO|nr:endonuclease/exonuclease/phosphatase family protein [Lapidilactobacillus gannanensis]MCH4057495.1 endonuclease/exonuclease/phosphatase family protein [Lactobacillaceae bacterium]
MKSSNQLKVITLNLPPLDKSHFQLGSSGLTDQTRSQRAITAISDQNPDIIFFIEEYGPLFAEIATQLRGQYYFIYPQDFQPSVRAFAGVVAAVKSSIKLQAQLDGHYFKINQTAKILGLQIADDWFIGVHYPQPAQVRDFDQKFKDSIRKLKPKLIVGDFNPVRGAKSAIKLYDDLLKPVSVTSLFHSKLDFVFIPEAEVPSQRLVFDHALMDPNSQLFLSDHALTGAILSP